MKYRKVSPASKDSKNKGGVLTQTGSLDWDIVGRSKKSAEQFTEKDFQSPTLLSQNVFGALKIKFIATSCQSCHSIAVDVNGDVYGWGRNEMGK